MLKRHTRGAIELARDLVPWACRHGVEVFIPHEHASEVPGASSIDESAIGALVELLVVLGGDGTLLHGAGLVAEQQVPVLGINLGHLGFLTPFDPPQARAALEAALAGALPVESRMRLEVTVLTGAGASVTRYACNDAVITQTAAARLLEIEATLDGELVTVYRADGLILATPTGSTAYTLAAGGPILIAGLRAMVMTAICPHTLTNRPLVVPAEASITVRVPHGGPTVLLTVDGQPGLHVDPTDTVRVRAAAQPLRIFQPAGQTPIQSYFQILRNKLHWGEREGS